LYARKTESIRRKVALTPTKVVEEEVAIKVAYRVMKNKVARVNEPAEFIVNLGTGVDIIDDTFTVAKQFGIIKTTGSWFSFGDKKAPGEAKFKESVMCDQALLEEIRSQCVKMLIERDINGYVIEKEVAHNEE
jgi:recombination protein RecA